MVKVFENKFLSVAGQKERFANVGATLKASLTGQGVKADTGSKAVDKVLSAAASNPFTTAAVVAVAAAPKVAATAVKQAVSSLTPKQQIAAAVVAPAAVSLAVSNPKGSAKAVASAPSSIAKFTSNVYETIKDPSLEKVGDIYKETPIIAGAVTGAAALIAGKGIQAAYYGSNLLDGTDKETIIKETPIKETALTSIPTSSIAPSKPLEPQLVNVSRSVSTQRRRSSKKSPIPSSSSVRVNIYNQTKTANFIKKLAY